MTSLRYLLLAVQFVLSGAVFAGLVWTHKAIADLRRSRDLVIGLQAQLIHDLQEQSEA